MRPTPRHLPVPLVAALGALLFACGPALEGERDPSIGEVGVVQNELCAAGPTLEGIDISYWQQSINWPAVKAAGKNYAMIRAGHGLEADTKFATNWAGAKAAGIPRGAYHWISPQYSVATQANIMINAMKTMGPDDLPPMLDVEERGGRTPAQITDAVREWIRLVKAATGRTPIIYTGIYFWTDYVKSTEFNQHPLWVPHYGVTCPGLPAAWSKWAFHQYSSTGRVGGISGNVDLDRFNGNATQLRDFITGAVGTTGTLMGTIYEGTDTTKKIVGATVTAGSQTVTTGADGIYRFTLPAGTYTATATKTGFQTATVMRAVTAGTTIWGSMGLTPGTNPGGTGTLAGLAYEYDPKNPTSTAKVLSGVVLTAGGASVTTTASGAFTLTVPVGTQSLTATKAGYGTATVMRAVTAGQTTQVNVGLSPAGVGDVKPPDLAISTPRAGASLDVATVTLTGTVSDESGAIAAVTVSLNGGATSDVAVTSGRFSTDVKLKPGSNTVTLGAKDAAGNLAKVEHALGFRAGVSGVVTKAGGSTPVAGTTVTLLSGSGAQLAEVAAKDGAYDFDLSDVPGEFVVVASAPGHKPTREAVEITDEARATLNLELVAGVEGNDGPPLVRFLNVDEGQVFETDTAIIEGETSGLDLESVTVNGVKATVFAGNLFNVSVPLTPGENTIEAVAIGAGGAKAVTRVIVQQVAPVKKGGCSAIAGLDLGALVAITAVLRRRSKAKR